MLEIPNIPEAILEEKKSRIRRTPYNSNRASGLGYSVAELEGCLRRGVYHRTAWQEAELHDARVQAIFDEGNQQERQVMKDVLAAGYEIIEAQTAYEWPEYKITGHIDGKIVCMDGDTPIAVPVEIKSMNPNIYATVHSFEDFRKKPWTRSYMCQITLYMLMQSIDKGIFILKDKSSGAVKQIVVDLDYELGEACIKTAEQINNHVEKGTLPDRVQDRDKCAMCPFKLKCLPDMQFGTEMRIADDPSLESKVEKMHDLKATVSEFDALKKSILPKLKASRDDRGELNVMLGKWHITGKTDGRGTFRPKYERL